MIEFILFFVYVTMIFFLPNTWWALGGSCIVTLLYCLLRKTNFRKILRGIVNIMPFILITFGFNVWLDSLSAAIFVMSKLLIVCWITLAYAQTLSVLKFARIIEDILSPLRKLGFDVDGVSLIICLALSMMPILRREVTETKYAMRAKGMNMNIRNICHITVRLFARSFRRIDELDMALRSKGII